MNVDMSHGQSDKRRALSLSRPLLGHIHARLKPHPHPGRLPVNDKHRIEPMGPRSPDAHHPALFMFENVLEEKCENAFSEHGGPERPPGCQGSHTIGAMRIGRIGLGTAATEDGTGQIGPFSMPSARVMQKGTSALLPKVALLLTIPLCPPSCVSQILVYFNHKYKYINIYTQCLGAMDIQVGHTRVPL